MWPIVLLAVVSGLVFELVKWGISDVRRHIYNRNRNRKYAEGKSKEKEGRKNMTWRKELPKKPHDKVPLPVPPGFAGDLCRQWDKSRDSSEEMVRFGEMMVELEDYVDNAFIFDAKGDIVGRHPGIKGFLDEYCSRIRYKTAMRYRILAMKAREAALRKKGSAAGEHARCRTIRELEGKLDTFLKVAHCRVEKLQKKHFRRRGGHDPQSAIFSIREAAHSAIGERDAPNRQRIVEALLELARELSAS